jgi:hypothetical protein
MVIPQMMLHTQLKAIVWDIVCVTLRVFERVFVRILARILGRALGRVSIRILLSDYPGI